MDGQRRRRRVRQRESSGRRMTFLRTFDIEGSKGQSKDFRGETLDPCNRRPSGNTIRSRRRRNDDQNTHRDTSSLARLYHNVYTPTCKNQHDIFPQQDSLCTSLDPNPHQRLPRRRDLQPYPRVQLKTFPLLHLGQLLTTLLQNPTIAILSARLLPQTHRVLVVSQR